MSRLLTPEEIEALRAVEPYIPAPRERFHVVIDAGHADLTSEEVASLKPGALIALDRKADEPVEVVANAVTIARGELTQVDGRRAVRIVPWPPRGAESRRTRP